MILPEYMQDSVKLFFFKNKPWVWPPLGTQYVSVAKCFILIVNVDTC